MLAAATMAIRQIEVRSTGDPFVGILRKFTRERLIGHHKPTSRFQNPEHLSKGQDEHLELLPWHWR